MPQRQSARFNVPRHDFSAFTRGTGQGAALAQRGIEQFAQGVSGGIADFKAIQQFNKEAEGRRKGTLELIESLEPFLPEGSKKRTGDLANALIEARPSEVEGIASGAEQSLKILLNEGAKAVEAKAKQAEQAKQSLIAKFAVNPSSMPANIPPEIALQAQTRAAQLRKLKADAAKAERSASAGTTPVGQRVPLPPELEKSGHIGVMVSPNSIAIKKADSGEELGWVFQSTEAAKEFADKNGIRGDIRPRPDGTVFLTKTKIGSGFDPLARLFDELPTQQPTVGPAKVETDIDSLIEASKKPDLF